MWCVHILLLIGDLYCSLPYIHYSNCLSSMCTLGNVCSPGVLAEGEFSKLSLWIHTSISAPVTFIMYALNLLKVYHKGIIVQ